MEGDRLRVEGIQVECRIGAYEWEQRTPQPIQIDVELAIDASRAAATDDLNTAVDYARLVTSVKTLAQRQPYRLIETLAEAIASLVLKECSTSEALVRVKKRSLPGIDHVAVEIHRRSPH